MAPRAVVLVPRRADGGHRDDLWDWCREQWWADLGLRIYEGHHNADEGLFSRAAAINRAALAADECGTPWDVGIVLDADTILDHRNLYSAALLAHASGQITFAFERFAALTREGSEQVRAGYRGDWEPLIEWTALNTASSCVAFPRSLWDAIGGFDEALAGWGFEDVQASLAGQAIGGGMHRIAGSAFHCWHPPAEGTGNDQSPIWQANRAQCLPYLEAGHADYDAMRKVLEDRGQWHRLG